MHKFSTASTGGRRRWTRRASLSAVAWDMLAWALWLACVLAFILAMLAVFEVSR
jgi:hypothetical protein